VEALPGPSLTAEQITEPWTDGVNINHICNQYLNNNNKELDVIGLAAFGCMGPIVESSL